ncbi:coiled-coil domain-containing protein 81-like, partial [Neopelma chrysocephalum]|uniref:coiled-coil domain-containing protein 81-like n=1 Tax=Neopelma chrysocephalum TaxID=114329 RepID=UPI000FCD2800
MGLGTIHIMKKPVWQGKLEGFLVDSPEFDVDKPFLVGNKLPHGNRLVPELSKADELLCAEVALRLHVPKATVVMCVKATMRVFEWALSSGQNFDFVFKDIGVLLCRGGHVDMRFFEELAREVAQSENLADSLLQVGLLRLPTLGQLPKVLLIEPALLPPEGPAWRMSRAGLGDTTSVALVSQKAEVVGRLMDVDTMQGQRRR